MDDVKKWLADNGDYQSGLSLYLKYCRNKNLCSYLSRRQDMLKLRYELAKLAQISTNIPSRTSAPDASLKPMTGLLRMDPAQLPDELKPVYEAAVESYHKARKFHTLMKDAGDDKTRAELRASLLYNIHKSRSSWAIIDKWIATKELPEAKVGTFTTAQFNAAAANLTRTIKSLEKCTDQVKVAELKDKAQGYIKILSEGGRSFKEFTLVKMREFGLIDA